MITSITVQVELSAYKQWLCCLALLCGLLNALDGCLFWTSNITPIYTDFAAPKLANTPLLWVL